MKFKIVLVLLAVFSILSSQGLSGIDPGYYDYNPRFTAMGGSGTGLSSSNSSTMFVNPAGLANMEGLLNFQAVNSTYLQLISYNYLGASHKRKNTVYSAALDFCGDEALTEYEMLVSAAWKVKDILPENKIFSRFNIGVNLRMLGASFGNNSDGAYYDESGLNHQVSGNAFGYALDWGMQYKINETNILGIFNRNLLSDMFYETSNQAGTALGSYSESKPVGLTFGYCYRKNQTVICIDYKSKLYSDGEDYLKSGFELGFLSNRISVRAGWSTQIFSLENNQFNMGCGINFDYAAYKFQIDIAYRIFSDWEENNNLIIGLSAGI